MVLTLIKKEVFASEYERGIQRLQESYLNYTMRSRQMNYPWLHEPLVVLPISKQCGAVCQESIFLVLLSKSDFVCGVDLIKF